MMGTLPEQRQPEFFSYHIDLERRIRPEHPLRQIKAALDLSFVIALVKDRYGRCGHTSLDPRVLVKLMFLLFYYDIPSERELMAQLSERLDWLWFLDFGLDTPVPHHSVLSKARARWGTEVFERLFVGSVEQCVQAGLVDGRLLHVDSTTIKANASKDSVLKSSPEMIQALRRAYQKEEQKLEMLPEPTAECTDVQEQPPAEGSGGSCDKEASVNQSHVSRTDPEAELARTKTGSTELSYKEHRLVDDAHGVITAVVETPGSAGDAAQMPALLEEHQAATALKLDRVTVAGDHHYGSANNYLYCAQQGIRAHLAPSSAQLKARGLLPVEDFVYEAQADRLRCPAGHYLVLHQRRPAEQVKVYLIQDPQLCALCPLRQRCTDAARGRSVRRHVQSQQLEELRAEACSPSGRYSRKRRKHVMEGSFADGANNHGLKRSRWRGLWRQQIQGWIIAAVQNLRLLLRRSVKQPSPAAINVQIQLSSVVKVSAKLFDRSFARLQALGNLWPQSSVS
jgi:transposase